MRLMKSATVVAALVALSQSISLSAQSTEIVQLVDRSSTSELPEGFVWSARALSDVELLRRNVAVAGRTELADLKSLGVAYLKVEDGSKIPSLPSFIAEQAGFYKYSHFQLVSGLDSSGKVLRKSNFAVFNPGNPVSYLYRLSSGKCKLDATSSNLSSSIQVCNIKVASADTMLLASFLDFRAHVSMKGLDDTSRPAYENLLTLLEKRWKFSIQGQELYCSNLRLISGGSSTLPLALAPQGSQSGYKIKFTPAGRSRAIFTILRNSSAFIAKSARLSDDQSRIIFD